MSDPMLSKLIYKGPEFRELLGLSESREWRLRRAGKIPPPDIPGRKGVPHEYSAETVLKAYRMLMGLDNEAA